MNFAERAVEYEVRRATEQHIESDPEVIAKSTLLAKALCKRIASCRTKMLRRAWNERYVTR